MKVKKISRKNVQRNMPKTNTFLSMTKTLFWAKNLKDCLILSFINLANTMVVIYLETTMNQ